METPKPHLILPVGTQVVCREDGRVGTIVEAPPDPTRGYRIQFPGGENRRLGRKEISIRKHHQREGIEVPADALSEYDLYDCVIYRCVIGSRAYGLDGPDSDTDRRGIYQAPASLHWSLFGAPEQLENEESQECYWELEKCLKLALKANPNVLEVLYSPIVETKTEVADELLQMRDRFLSKLVYQTYNGYVMSQFKKLEQDLRARGGIKWKHAMHLIRLLLSGTTILEQGTVPVEVGEHRRRLLSIKAGDLPWGEVNDWRLQLHRQFDQAYETTGLPERPDYEAANAFLIRARRGAV